MLGAGAEPPNARLLRWTRTVMLVEAVDERAHAVVPQLHDAIVETAKYPRAARMKRESLDPVALGLELGQHLHLGLVAVQASEAVAGPRAAGPARRPRLFAPPAALGGLSPSAVLRSIDAPRTSRAR